MTNIIKETLQPLFPEKLLRIDHLNANQANTNDVYLVTADNKQSYVIKILKDTNINRSTFWQRLNLLFNKTIVDSIYSQTAIAEFINKLQIIAPPTIINSDHTSNNPLNAPYVIMTQAAGQPILPNSDMAADVAKNKDIAYQLGCFVSAIHAQHFEYFGNMSGEGLPR